MLSAFTVKEYSQTELPAVVTTVNLNVKSPAMTPVFTEIEGVPWPETIDAPELLTAKSHEYETAMPETVDENITVSFVHTVNCAVEDVMLQDVGCDAAKRLLINKTMKIPSFWKTELPCDAGVKMSIN